MANEEKEAIKFKELEKRVQQLEKQIQPIIDIHSAKSFKSQSFILCKFYFLHSNKSYLKSPQSISN